MNDIRLGTVMLRIFHTGVYELEACVMRGVRNNWITGSIWRRRFYNQLDYKAQEENCLTAIRRTYLKLILDGKFGTL
jgi:hypothetical protein